MRERTQADEALTLGDQMVSDFLAMLDTWHAAPEVFDDALDAQIHRWYADILTNRSRKVWPPKGVPYFSPSSVDGCRRALYEKLRGAKKDVTKRPPHHGRWQRIGTAIGDSIQRDILFIEKHYRKEIGQAPRFKFERNELNEPMFEDFAKKSHFIEHNGKRFALYGTCDGILLYQTDDGEIIRVGLEVKSKQTTAAKTSLYSMRGPQEDHAKQCITYALMYGVDHYIILYVNASKYNWKMTDEQYEKTPDRRAFHLFVTERDKQALLDELADVVQSVEDGNPPPVNPEKWEFNGFKTAIARSLTDEEFAQLERKVAQVLRSRMPDAKKRDYARCLDDIVRIRKEII
ncbi:hypothetical protein [Paenibacillus dendritiformis]|uniref:hypothetical protein n=1 Tax=Paenibacillus dendritiformis TaxID=130049 RepID=UPI00387E1B27